LRFATPCRKGDRTKIKGKSDVSSDQNIRAAEATYAGFVGLVKWGTIACVLIAALVILLIS
jgi:hypothetical protein